MASGILRVFNILLAPSRLSSLGWLEEEVGQITSSLVHLVFFRKAEPEIFRVGVFAGRYMLPNVDSLASIDPCIKATFVPSLVTQREERPDNHQHQHRRTTLFRILNTVCTPIPPLSWNSFFLPFFSCFFHL